MTGFFFVNLVWEFRISTPSFKYLCKFSREYLKNIYINEEGVWPPGQCHLTDSGNSKLRENNVMPKL